MGAMKDKRQARKAARVERVQKKQAKKTERMERRLDARANRQAIRQDKKAERVTQRKDAQASRQAGRQQKRLDKVLSKNKTKNDLTLAAANAGQAPEDMAENMLRQPDTLPKVQTYIQNQGGEELMEEGMTPAEMAAIANELREEEITDTQEALNEELEEGEQPYSMEEAEQFCFDASEADSFDGDSYDYFDPVTAAAVSAAARKGAELIKKKRAAEGKSTKLLDDVQKFLTPDQSNKPASSDLGKVVEEGINTYKEKTIQDKMPLIILIAAALLFVGYMLAKKK